MQQMAIRTLPAFSIAEQFYFKIIICVDSYTKKDTTMQWDDRIGSRIKLRDLHIALAVAQSGSMLKAAEALAISQPVVSRVIADLEQALGVRLFDRSRKGVEPTASGRALLNRGRAAFDELKQG